MQSAENNIDLEGSSSDMQPQQYPLTPQEEENISVIQPLASSLTQQTPLKIDLNLPSCSYAKTEDVRPFPKAPAPVVKEKKILVKIANIHRLTRKVSD